MSEAVMEGSLAGSARRTEAQCYGDLAMGIVRQAVTDYEKVLLRLLLRSGNREALMRQKLELECFFHSEWYGILCDISPQKLKEQVRRNATDKAKAVIRRRNKKKLDSLMKSN